MASASEYFSAAAERESFLTEQIARLGESRDRLEADAAQAAEQLDHTWRELAGYLLPEVHDALLQDLQTRLTYPGLLPIRDDYAARLAAAEVRRAALAQRDEVIGTDVLLAGVRDELDEIASSATAFDEELTAWRASRWFTALSARGWFADDYRPAGLLRRFADWRAVSFLMTALATTLRLRLRDPAAVRAHWRRLAEDSAPVLELRDRLVARRAEIEAIRTEHDDLVAAPARLRHELYVALAAAIRAHLEACPVDLRYALAKGDPHLVTFFKKLDGLDAKRRYLKELRVTRVDSALVAFQQQRQKLRTKVSRRTAKRRRGRFGGIADAEVAALRDLQADKWQRRHDKLDRVRDRISGFDRWDDGSFVGTVLWWDVMTRGARGDDLYEVRTFHEQWGGAVAHDHPHAHLDAELLAVGHYTPDAADALAADMAADEPDLDWSDAS